MLDINSYETKVREVEAVMVKLSNMNEVANWCGGLIEGSTLSVPNIRTGTVFVNEGDFLLRESNGSFSKVTHAYILDNLNRVKTTTH